MPVLEPMSGLSENSGSRYFKANYPFEKKLRALALAWSLTHPPAKAQRREEMEEAPGN